MRKIIDKNGLKPGRMPTLQIQINILLGVEERKNSHKSEIVVAVPWYVVANKAKIFS